MTAARTTVRSLAVSSLAACYAPSPAPACAIACGQSEACPWGLVCSAGLCAEPGGMPCVPAPGDGAIDVAFDATRLACPTGMLHACWLMEGDGADGSGNDNHAPPMNVSFVPGKIGLAAHFDGVTSRMTVVAQSSFELPVAGTLEAWIRPSEIPTTQQVRAGIFDNNGAYSMFLMPSAAIRCSGGGGHEGGVLAVDVWTHVACVYDAGAVRVVVNGVVVTSGGGMAGGAGDSLDIGSDSPWVTGVGQFRGEIDQLFVWAEARSVAQLCESAGLVCP